MKKICISFLIVAIIILSGFGLNLKETPIATEYLRIHIRADSNDARAQAVKYAVKDAVVNYLAPFIAECDTREKAEKTLSSCMSGVESVANKVLEANGFTYKSNAQIKTEKFPTRFYKNLCLESGEYRALIINLGSGKGDNWWCVVYPPLCFTGEKVSYIYRSKIKDLIDEIMKRAKP
jgi:stage II sporulation protein R